MEFFGSLIDDESQNNFDFLKESNLHAQPGAREKKSSFTNSLINYAGNNTGNTANTNLQNPSFFSQTNNTTAYNPNNLYTPLNSSNNYTLPQFSSNYQEGKFDENYNSFPNNMLGEAFELGSFPLTNKQKISSELIENIRDFEEMFMGRAGKANPTKPTNLNPSMDNTRKLYKPPNKKEEMNPWSYEPIKESNDDDETPFRMNERDRQELKKDYRADMNEHLRKGLRGGVERDIPDALRKEYIPREVMREKTSVYNEMDRVEAEMESDNYPINNSQKTRFNLNKNPIQPNQNPSYITNQNPNEGNLNKNKQTNHNPNLKLVDNTLVDRGRSYDSLYVEKTRKNNRKVAIFIDNKKKEALMAEFVKDYQAVTRQLQEKKEKLKMVTNLSKFHEKLYSKNEDFRKKVPVFFEKYLENYQRNLENYKLIIALHDTEIDVILNEYEQRMEKIKEKFKF